MILNTNVFLTSLSMAYKIRLLQPPSCLCCRPRIRKAQFQKARPQTLLLLCILPILLTIASLFLQALIVHTDDLYLMRKLPTSWWSWGTSSMQPFFQKTFGSGYRALDVVVELHGVCSTRDNEAQGPVAEPYEINLEHGIVVSGPVANPKNQQELLLQSNRRRSPQHVLHQSSQKYVSKNRKKGKLSIMSTSTRRNGQQRSCKKALLLSSTSQKCPGDQTTARIDCKTARPERSGQNPKMSSGQMKRF